MPASDAGPSIVRHPVLLILLVSALTCLAGLGRPAISDSDEAFYAEAGREMVETGDLLTPQYNYANRFQKPVLYYWLVAAGFALTGVNEAAARWGAAASGIGLALIAWFCGRRWFDPETGLVAGFILATSLGCVAIARLALPDLPLTFFISLSVASALCGLFEPSTACTRAMIVSGAAAGAAVLTKGPIGLIIPMMIVGTLTVIERRWRALRPLPLAVATGIFALIAAPWFVAMTRAHGTAYLDSFFVGDNLERFATDRFNEPRPAWFYLPVILGGMLPWSPLFALWIEPAWRFARQRRKPAAAYVRLLAWSVLPLLVFTVSVGKQPRYILPMLPPLAIALSATLCARLRRGDPAVGWLTRSCIACTGVVIAVIGVFLTSLPADALGVSAPALAAGGIASVFAGAFVIGTSFRRVRSAPYAITGAAVVLVISLQYGLLSLPGAETVQQVALRVRSALEPGTHWTTYRVFVRNLVFYVARPEAGPFDTDEALVAFLRQPAATLVVLRQDDVVSIERQLGRPLYRLAEWRYFNVAGLRASVLLDGKPRAALKGVVLVSNRSP
jgi:4-amino-4-deoxy-L-arabinose transferase-like glycosyltransferase